MKGIMVSILTAEQRMEKVKIKMLVKTVANKMIVNKDEVIEVDRGQAQLLISIKKAEKYSQEAEKSNPGEIKSEESKTKVKKSNKKEGAQ